MKPCGEVGLLMNLSGENTGSEILKSLLTSSKMQKSEPVEVSILSNLEPRTQPDDQIVFQLELNSIKSEFNPRNENIIQHIPVTYLSTNNSNLTQTGNRTEFEPISYVLSQNIISEKDSRCFTFERIDPQKIFFLQGVDSGVTQNQCNNSEVKPYEIKEIERTKSNIESRNEKLKEGKKTKTENCNGFQGKTRKKQKEDSEGAKVKVEKKISTMKRPINKRKNSKLKTKLKTVGKGLIKKSKKPLRTLEDEKPEEMRNLFELTKLEDNVDQVAERLKIGCECSDSNCFDGLKPDDVFKHRLNIADLTKAEHDMYLMGVIMASIHNLEETCRHKERIRIRSCYAYQGKKVCLTAFLYLQHVTLYQMKRLRSHLKNHGVSPRIHGNRGRKPANTFSLDIYRRATNFVQKYIEEHCVKTVPNYTKAVESKSKMTSYHLPPEFTKRNVHREYKIYCENLKPVQKVMKYSTFTNFLKKQFPNVKFHKKEEKKQEKMITVKLEESDGWKNGEKRTSDDQGVDKSVQVDKTLVYLPTKTQILINGQQLEMYDESGAASQVVVSGQNSEQFV